MSKNQEPARPDAKILKDKDYWNYLFQSSAQLRYPNEVVIRFLKSNFLTGSGADLLDLGCGNGVNGIMAMDLGFNVYFLDSSEVAIGEIRKRKIVSDDKIKQQDILEDFGYENKFDVIISISVIYHITSQQLPEVIRKISRNLKPGGIFLANFLPKKNLLFSGPKEKIAPNSFLIKNESWLTHKKVKYKKASEIICSFFDEAELRKLFEKDFSKVKIIASETPTTMSLDNDREETYSMLWVLAKK